MHAVQRRDAVILEMRGHCFVGQQHELLDDAMRDVTLARDDRLDLTNLGQDDLGLRQVEVDRAAPPPPRD